MSRFHTLFGALVFMALSIIPANAAEPGPFDPAAATAAYLSQLSGEARAKSDAYFEGGYTLDAIDAGVAVAIALLLLFLGVSAAMRNWAEARTGSKSLQVFLYSSLYVILTTLLSAPFIYYRQFLREHEFGLANQTLPEWLQDQAIGLGVDIVLGGLFLVLLYVVLRSAGNRVWLWATALTAAFMAFTILISPVFVSPLFNTYKPMTEGKLKDEILAMARANGIPADNVYQFDASKQHKRISANVSGLLGTTRISLNDNLLNRGTPAEIKSVMGHEMGHYVLNHIYKFLIALTLLFAVVFAFVQWAFTRLVGAFGTIWGVRGIGDVAGLPLLSGLMSLTLYAATPLLNTMIRVSEAEADNYGLNAAREPDGFATIALKLAEYRKLEPGPWEEFVFYDHPSGRARVWMAMQWKAENLAPIAVPPTAPAPSAPPPPP
jgi:STE24 endopeptidase